MPRPRKTADLPPDIKVMIRNAQGKYLAQDDHGLFLTEDRSAAIVLDYRNDRVEEQLQLIHRTRGISLVADPVPLEEIYERCDRCRELFVPFMITFDGSKFVCEDCRKRASSRRKAR